MKNLNKIQIIVLAALAISSFTSCKKHHHDEPAAESVIIDIITPKDQAEYEKGDTVFINVRITAPSSLHGYELHMTRLEDTTEVFSFDEDVHSSAIDINKFWVNDGAKHSEVELEVIAVIDHAGKTTNKKVQFHCHN